LNIANTIVYRLSTTAPSTKQFFLGTADTLKVVLTATEGDDAKRPHQAFLTLRETATGLEESFPISIRASGKGDVKVVCRPAMNPWDNSKLNIIQTQKDLPLQLLTAESPLKASLVLASFGSSTPLNTVVFDLTVARDSSVPMNIPEKPLRYGKLEEIHHIFRADPKSGPKIFSIVFTLAVLATVPILLGGWLTVGANVKHFTQTGSASVSHIIFFGSLVAMEGIFFMYYSNWSLFQMLPASLVVGVVAFFSGNKALSEVQERRLGGKR